MDKQSVPTWVSTSSRSNFLLSKEQVSDRLAILEQLAGPHIAWYTHKNPFSCWICDYIILCRRLVEILEGMETPISTKSPLDLMNEQIGQGVRYQDELD